MADLCLSCGSSLTVTPAADIPTVLYHEQLGMCLYRALQLVATNHGDLVIVNLQRTPLDRLASLRIYAKCDDVSRLLAEKLSLQIPSFQLHRYCVTTETTY